ncbi:MAG: hypothetical protein QNJ53_22365 [Pleurocapsa sp. MO_192.B19]|nr:hypothetical protein [Pleurocapsa sp. MO_192.B19]
MSKKKRVSLSTRLQPYSGTLLAEVVEWLNEHQNDEKNNLIAEAVIMAYLPYARASQGVSNTEIERCCWETQNMLDKHGFNLRQSLQVSQPQWHSAVMRRAVSTPSSILEPDGKGELPQLDEEDESDLVPSSLIAGEGEYDDSPFADDEFS